MIMLYNVHDALHDAFVRQLEHTRFRARAGGKYHIGCVGIFKSFVCWNFALFFECQAFEDE